MASSGDGVWHSTCGFPGCVEPSRYAADSTCKGCRRIKYCTFACQKADWKRHRPACKAAEAADEAAARAGALVVLPRARPAPGLLRAAAATGDAARVDELLLLGADVNEADDKGKTPLHAVFADNTLGSSVSDAELLQIAGRLLAAPGVNVDAGDAGGWTALHYAAVAGHGGAVRRLLASKASVNAKTSEGFTALFLAAEWPMQILKLDVRCFMDVVATLLAAPGVAVNETTNMGKTPLRGALATGNTAIAVMLKKAGGHE